MSARAAAWRAGVLAVCLLAPAAPALGQSPAAGRWPVEISAGVALSGGESFGTANANLLTPTGGTLTLFRTSSRLAAGLGFDVHLGLRVTSHLSIETAGGLRHAQLETTASGDFEAAAPATITESTSRFTVEGAALWAFGRHSKLEPFLRGGAGWTRELSSDGALAQNGWLANIGGGVKYWWHESARGPFGRLGVRVDGAAVVRHGGISLSTRTRFVSPSLAGSIIIGW